MEEEKSAEVKETETTATPEVNPVACQSDAVEPAVEMITVTDGDQKCRNEQKCLRKQKADKTEDAGKAV